MTDITKYTEEMVKAGMARDRAEHIVHRVFIAGLAAAVIRQGAVKQSDRMSHGLAALQQRVR